MFPWFSEGNIKRTAKLSCKKLKFKKSNVISVSKLNERVRNESISSNASYNSDDADNRFQSANFIDFCANNIDECENTVLTNEISLSMSNVKLQDNDNASESTSGKNSWIKVNNKHQHSAVGRLRAIAVAKEAIVGEDLSYQSFQKLGTKASENCVDIMKLKPHVYTSTNVIEKPTFEISNKNFPVLQSSHTIHEHTGKTSHKHR